jgi:hypothetical protein
MDDEPSKLADQPSMHEYGTLWNRLHVEKIADTAILAVVGAGIQRTSE